MKTLTAFLMAAFFGLFVSLFLLMFAGGQAAQFDETLNLTSSFDETLINDTIASGSQSYDDFQSSQSDQSSQISLFKNAPGTIKDQTRLGVKIYSRLFESAFDNYVPIWAVGIIFAMFILVIVAILIRMATGQTL